MESEHEEYLSEEGKVELKELIDTAGRVQKTETLLALGVDEHFKTVDLHLGRLKRLFDIEVEVLKPLFSFAEWQMLFNTANGSILGSCEEAIEASLLDHYENEFCAFEVDKELLIAKVRNLNIGQKFALINFLENYWSSDKLSHAGECKWRLPSFEEYLEPKEVERYFYIH